MLSSLFFCIDLLALFCCGFEGIVGHFILFSSIKIVHLRYANYFFFKHIYGTKKMKYYRYIPCFEGAFERRKTLQVFKASALWADAFYKSISRFVRLFVCLCVCMSVCSLLRYCLTVFLLRMSKIFTDLESLGKSNGKKWSQI